MRKLPITLIFKAKYLMLRLGSLVFFSFLLVSELQAQQNGLLHAKSKSWQITENIGQLQSPDGKQLNDILFYGRQGKTEIYFRKDRISFVFVEPEVIEKGHLTASTSPIPETQDAKQDALPNINRNCHYSRMDMIFANASKSVDIQADEKFHGQTNFISGGKEFRQIASFGKLTYKNIYPHTDLEILCREAGLKYQFVIHPGGNPDNINIKWGGCYPEIQPDGGIIYRNGLGYIQETAPISYQPGSKSVSSSFAKKSGPGALGFNVGKYDKKADLVIDPDLKWATYAGGSNQEFTFGNPVTDPTTNIYITGECMSANAIASTGAWQGTIPSQYSAFVIKFNPFGARVWGTYFGGNNGTFGFGLDLNKFGQLYITGTTYATNLGKGNVFKDSLSGSYDGFIARFDTTGGFHWCTYFGGNDGENALDIKSDKSGNLYICGNTKSDNGLSYGAKIHQPARQGGEDAFLARFDTSGARIWATYLGGSGDDKFNAIGLDPSGNIFAGGTTNSSKGISSGHSNLLSFQGGLDGFIEKFNPDGSVQWGSYAGGNGVETGTGIAPDIYGNVYLCGNTNSGFGIGTGSGAWQLKLAGKKAAYIAKFTGSGTLFWSTYFGGTASEDGLKIACDFKGRVAITGAATSDSLATSNGLHLSRSTNTQDGYVAVFSPTGPLEYCSYFGGENSESGKGLVFDANGNIIVCGETYSTSGIATPKSWQPNNGGLQDLFLFKLSCISMSPVSLSGPLDFCSYPTFATYQAVTFPGTTYKWRITGGHVVNGQKSSTVVVSWDKIGLGEIWSIQKNSEGCTDSAMLSVSVHMSDTLKPIKGRHYVCKGAQAGFSIDTLPGARYFWKAVNGQVATGQFTNLVTTKWDTVGTFELTVRQTTLSGCIDTITIFVTVGLKDSIPPIIGKPIICKGLPAAFKIDSLAGAKYGWSVKPGQIISGQGTDSINVLVHKRDSVTILLSITGRGSCNGIDTFKAICKNPAKLDLGPDQLFCPLDSPPPIISLALGFVSCLWMPGKDTNAFIRVIKDTFYTLHAIDTIGCEVSDSVQYIRRCPPACYMPTAFSPNSDGLNDTLMPVGQDVEDYRIVIINRWGEVVFESKNNRKGWDGNFHHKPAPEGIYRWYLEYRGYDTSHLNWETKQGNVWLKRE